VSDEVENYRAKARAFTEQAQQATDLEDRVYLTRMARSYMLMAKNAEWLRNNNAFLKAVRDGKRWPIPESANDQGPSKAANA
jgi:hypothetical protein